MTIVQELKLTDGVGWSQDYPQNLIWRDGWPFHQTPQQQFSYERGVVYLNSQDGGFWAGNLLIMTIVDVEANTSETFKVDFSIEHKNKLFIQFRHAVDLTARFAPGRTYNLSLELRDTTRTGFGASSFVLINDDDNSSPAQLEADWRQTYSTFDYRHTLTFAGDWPQREATAYQPFDGPGKLPITLPPLPRGISNGGAGLVDGRIYAIYGDADQPPHWQWLQVLDLRADDAQWQVVEFDVGSKYYARDDFNVITAGRSIYLVGGRTDPISFSSRVDRLDFNDGVQLFTNAISLITPRSQFSSAVTENAILLIGGTSGLHAPDLLSIEMLNLASHSPPTQEISPKLKSGHYGSGSVIAGNNLYIVSKNGPEWLDLTASNPSWQALPALNQPRYELPLINIGHKIFAIGGKSAKPGDRTILDTIEVLDLAQSTLKWQTLPHRLQPERAAHDALPYGEQIILIGGFNRPGGAYNALKSIEILTKDILNGAEDSQW